jgi:hypothetical protein
MVKRGDYVILDNGAAEDLVYGAKHLHTLADLFSPQEIVVQDVIGNANDTLAMGQGFTRYARPEYRYMFVVQGTTHEEVLTCLRVIDNSSWAVYVTTIGIPRHFETTIEPNYRARLTEWLIINEFDLSYDIHFLGANRNVAEVGMLEEMTCDRPREDGHMGFRGIDTSLPIVMGYADRDVILDEYVSRPPDYFDITNYKSTMDHNVDTYLEWANYESA